ncbi:septum formation initiator family protein [uncultured Tessaracoccus sp.]|uniref:FtsB family cell division protein n=1 Tax=uncultured Tessaracoccus sp. TaxID=905023 RepID=UPI0025ED4DFA|nr:septum formation initiator family protein [uncultured Tessaracoccus sp.]
MEPQQAGGVEQSPTHRSRTGGVTWRLVVLGVVVLGLAVVFGQSLRIYLVQASELAEVRERISTTKEDISRQRDELERWKDPEYVRSQARVRLGWVMPGEVGYRVIGPDGKPIDGSETVGDMADDAAGPWYERMWTSVQVADEPVREPVRQPGTDRDRVLEPESPSPSPSHS